MSQTSATPVASTRPFTRSTVIDQTWLDSKLAVCQNNTPLYEVHTMPTMPQSKKRLQAIESQCPSCMRFRALGYSRNPSTLIQIIATVPPAQSSHHQELLIGRMPSQSPTPMDPATPTNKLNAIA